jgi:hypothetical protein
MMRPRTTFSLGVAALLAAAACWAVPQGITASRLLAAQDDPAALSDLALDGRFDAARAAREIDAALAADDPELAQGMLDLAGERGIAVAPERAARVAAATEEKSSTGHAVMSFAKGFVTGEPSDAASLTGTVAGDLFVFGDLRDAVREGTRAARGEETNQLVLGLALGGLAVTVGTYASAGLATPARAGLSVVKAAGRAGHLSAGLLRAVRVERGSRLLALAGDVGQVQAKAGTRAALDGLRLAEEPKDMARLASLAVAKGGKTRAVLKLAGRGALVLTRAATELALWVLGAAWNLIAFIAACKRSAERVAAQAIRRRKERRRLPGRIQQKWEPVLRPNAP